MYVLEWRIVSVLTRGLFCCLFPELRSNEGNKYQNNTRGDQWATRWQSALATDAWGHWPIPVIQPQVRTLQITLWLFNPLINNNGQPVQLESNLMTLKFSWLVEYMSQKSVSWVAIEPSCRERAPVPRPGRLLLTCSHQKLYNMRFCIWASMVSEWTQGVW